MFLGVNDSSKLFLINMSKDRLTDTGFIKYITKMG